MMSFSRHQTTKALTIKMKETKEIERKMEIKKKIYEVSVVLEEAMTKFSIYSKDKQVRHSSCLQSEKKEKMWDKGRRK